MRSKGRSVVVEGEGVEVEVEKKKKKRKARPLAALGSRDPLIRKETGSLFAFSSTLPLFFSRERVKRLSPQANVKESEHKRSLWPLDAGLEKMENRSWKKKKKACAASPPASSIENKSMRFAVRPSSSTHQHPSKSNDDGLLISVKPSTSL